MEGVDLNINNYSLDDLLKLFHLSYNFTESELKDVKKSVLMTHPDKSKLDQKYFFFFLKAYKMLNKIYYFRGKRDKNRSTEYITDDDDHIELIRSLDGKSVKEFNDLFNKMFDSIKLKDDEEDTGYGDWLKTEEVEEMKNVKLSDFGVEFEKRKKKCQELILHNDISDINSSNGSNLCREKLSCYDSTIFSKLRFEDVKKAHTETVVPVTMEDFERKKQFNNMDEYIQHREKEQGKPLSVVKSKEYLNKVEFNDRDSGMRRAYNLLKRDEEMEKAQEDWWKNFKRLKG
tara:strand:+ start:1803 stop:2666 length:864 start_codon:yes stop_codon:yes gene_type:complete